MCGGESQHASDSCWAVGREESSCRSCWCEQESMVMMDRYQVTQGSKANINH